ncbi:MAG: DUF393 domain-containing protein [Phycisphaerales bacterium]
MNQGSFRLFFDGSCGLCRAIVRRLRRLRASTPIEPVDIHDDRSMAMFPQIDRCEAEQTVILLGPCGRQRRGYDAVVGVLTLLPSMRWMTPALEVRPIRALGAAVYGWVSKRRHRISRVLGLR